MVIHQQFPDFVVFLYVHIALTEGAIRPEQKNVILAKMKQLFPDGNDLDQKLDIETRKYYDFDKRKLITLFRDTFRTFSKVTFIQRYWICSDLYAIARAGESPASSKAIEALKEIMDLAL